MERVFGEEQPPIEESKEAVMPPGSTWKGEWSFRGKGSITVESLAGPIRVDIVGPGEGFHSDQLVAKVDVPTTVSGRWKVELKCMSTWAECRAKYTIRIPSELTTTAFVPSTPPPMQYVALWEGKAETFPPGRSYVQRIDIIDATWVNVTGSSSAPLDVCIVQDRYSQAFAEGRTVEAFQCMTGATTFDIAQGLAGGQRIGVGVRCQMSATCAVNWTLALTAY